MKNFNFDKRYDYNGTAYDSLSAALADRNRDVARGGIRYVVWDWQEGQAH